MAQFISANTILHNGVYIPVDAGNRDYRELIASGVEIAALDELTAWRARAAVSRFQAFAALDAAGLLDDATAAVTAAGGVALLAWNNAIEFRRNSPTIAALAGAVGLTAEQLDALFLAAAEIEA